MTIKIKTWGDLSEHPISLEAIKELYSPKEHYRFTADGYAGGAHFVGTLAMPVAIYVLEGTLRYTVNDVVVQLSRGEFAELDACNYICDVPIGNDVRLIRVIQLPEKFRK